MSKQALKRFSVVFGLAAGLCLPAQAVVTFSTFISGSDINAALGQNNTIAITFAGDRFVGSVYVGANNLQLYQSDLNGLNVQKFGTLITSGGGEPVLAASLGQAGFATAEIFVSAADSKIYRYSHTGGAPTLFGSTDDGSGVRQIFFDPGNSFGGKMLVTTTSGHVLSYDGSGNRSLIANLGEDTEGMDIATANYGQYAGQLLVASEGSGRIRAISAAGVVTVLQSSAGGNIAIPSAETVSTVPLDLGLSGNPLEGFYVGNYPVDVQKANASQFAGMQGNVVVTSEFGANSTVWELVYNGDVANNFSVSNVGTIPNQSEDGIFVTAQRIVETGHVPEPGGFGLVALALAGLAFSSRSSAQKVQPR